MSAEALCLAGDAALLALAVVGGLVAQRPFGRTVVYGGAFVLSALMLVVAIDALAFGGRSDPLVLPLGLPWIGARFHVDALSAFFLIVVNLAAAASSLYALGYGRHEHDPERVLPFFPAFLAGMNLVLVAADAYAFLLSWEFMSLASWALVMAHHREDQNARAGYVYLVMASFGTLSLLVAFALLAGPDGHYAFEAIRAVPPVGNLAILAFARRADRRRLQGRPRAVACLAAARPSRSAKPCVGADERGDDQGGRLRLHPRRLRSRRSARLAAQHPGADRRRGSGFIGVLQALMDNDLKRVLAYSTIENIGLIFVGLGLAYAFHASEFDAAAALAMTAALLHAFNHALFKSLLFFGAGAVLTATGERRLDRLGGLLNRMPATGFHARRRRRDLGPAAAQRLCLGVDDPAGGAAEPELPAMDAENPRAGGRGELALTAALAAACFVRAFGIPFLGRPRSEAAEAPRKSIGPRWRRWLCWRLLCLLAGVFPGQAIDALSPASQFAVGAHMPTQSTMPWLSIAPVAASRSSYNGLLVLLFIVVSATMASTVIHRFASAALSRAPAWDCGFPDPSADDAIQRREFQPADPPGVRPASPSARARTVDMPAPGDTRPPHFNVRLSDRSGTSLYAPLLLVVERTAAQLNRLQFLTIRQYLSVVFARAGRPSARARGMAMIDLAVDLVFQLLQMTLVIVLAPLLTGWCARPRRGCCAVAARRCSSPIATSCGWRARRRSSPTAPPGSSASRPTSSSPRPGSPQR